MQESFKIEEPEKVPINRETRVKQLMELSSKQKASFVPPVGAKFQIGACVFRVSVTNVGQMRFTATLHDVVIEGVNDGN